MTPVGAMSTPGLAVQACEPHWHLAVQNTPWSWLGGPRQLASVGLHRWQGRPFYCLEWLYLSVEKPPKKNGEMGKLGQDRLEVRWEAVMFLFNLVIWNVWLFLFEYLAKCFVEVVVIMFGFNEGRFCWGCFACYDFRFMFSVCSLSLMFYVVGVLGLFCP